MAITVGDALLKLGVDKKDFDRDLKAVDNSVKGRMESMGGSIRKAGLAFTAFGAVGLAVGGMLVKAASDAEESRAKFDTVFGFMADDVAAWAEETSASVGRSKHDFIEWLAALQDTFVPLGFARDEAAAFAQTLVELTVDVASFQNAAEADVLRDFQSAIVGNHETVRKYGIIISEATLQQEIMNQGWAKSKDEITDAMKVQGRMNLIMAGTADAQGDAMRTADSFANTARALKSQLSDMAADLGANLLPMLSDLIRQVGVAVAWFRDWAKEHPELVGWMLKAGVAVAGISLVLGPLLLMLPTLVTSLTMVAAAMKVVWLAMMGPVGIVIALGALAVILGAMFLKQNKVSDSTAGMRRQFVELYGPTSDVVTKFDELTASGLDAADAMKEMAKESTEMAEAALTAAEAQLALLRLQTATMNELRDATRGASKDAVDAYDAERLALVDTIRTIRAQLAGLGEDAVETAKTTSDALKIIDEDYIAWVIDKATEEHDIRVQAYIDYLRWLQGHYIPAKAAIGELERQEGESFNDWFIRTHGDLIGAIKDRTQADKDALDERIGLGNFWTDYQKGIDQETADRAKALADILEGIALDTDAKLREIERDRAAELRQIWRDLAAGLITKAEAIVLIRAAETSAATQIDIATELSTTLQQIASDLSAELITSSSASVLTAIALENANLRIAIAKEEAKEIVRSIELQEKATLQLRKAQKDLAGEERDRLNLLLEGMTGGDEVGQIGFIQERLEKAQKEKAMLEGKDVLQIEDKVRIHELTKEIDSYTGAIANLRKALEEQQIRVGAWDAMEGGAREWEARARELAKEAGMSVSDWKAETPDWKEQAGWRPSSVPGWAPPGAGPPGMGIFDPTMNEIATEVNRLLDRLETNGRLSGSEGGYLTPGYTTANIILELDGSVIAEVVGQEIVDRIRIRQGGAVG